MRGKGRIGIVHPWSNFDTIPSLCNTALLLAQHGYEVTIFTNLNPTFKYPDFDSHDITIDVLQYENPIDAVARSSNSLGNRFQELKARYPAIRNGYRILRSPYTIATLGIKYASSLLHAVKVLLLHRRSPFICVIGVDPEGLLQARNLTRFVRIPLAYYSLELLLSYEVTNEKQRQLKQQEKKLSHKAKFIIIQDKERAGLLVEDNKLPLDKCVLVPNSPLGSARREPSFYWHQRFNLSQSTRVVLHAGSISKWTGVEDIVSSVKLWPENWVLVVHTRYEAEASEDLEKLRSLADPERVFFSLNPVPRQEYNLLVDGADIGIAFYMPHADSTYTQSNIQAIGLSSGKIAYYLQSGLPVIVNDTTSIGEFLQREGCGVEVAEEQDIGKAIAKIVQGYDEYSRNACMAFDNHLNFESSFQEIIKRINGLRTGLKTSAAI